jgi:hypothetical protein
MYVVGTINIHLGKLTVYEWKDEISNNEYYIRMNLEGSSQNSKMMPNTKEVKFNESFGVFYI